MPHDFYDLPTTAERKNRWVQVVRRPNGAILCVEWSTSVETGWDLPLEYTFIRPTKPECPDAVDA
jgi:hypothetical protein